MARKTGLGKGLDALIPPGEGILPPTSVALIPVDIIQRNPRQPRQRFETQELTELAASIREHGVIQPLIVRRGANPTEYFLVAGERRLIAARQAGLRTVPAIVREATDLQHLELSLIENLQRADLTPLETAEAYQQLVGEFDLSHEEVAKRVGKSRVTVTNTLRLLKLPLVAQQALNKDLISEGHARALLALPTVEAQTAALQTVLVKELNVRQTEELVRKMGGQRVAPRPRPSQDPELTELEERLRAHLGTKIRLNRGRKGGTIVIHYYSDEELNALIDRLLTEFP